jgi:hypothetical protein
MNINNIIIFSEVVFKMNDEGGMDRSIDHRGGTPHKQINCLPFFSGYKPKPALFKPSCDKKATKKR